MAKQKPFSKSKRSFSGITGMEANHLPEAVPPKKSIFTSLLKQAKKNKRDLISSLSHPSGPTSSSNLPLFFTLPPELRQQIYTYVFANNGVSDLRQHLIHGRFCLDRRSYTVLLGLRILLVSKQFYADAMPVAYAQSVFYTSFRATETNDSTSVFPTWGPEMRRRVKHLAIWSDPFSWARTLGAIEGAKMRLNALTLCDSNVNNYMRDEGVNICVAEWLLDISKSIESLRDLRFFLAKINAVFKGAGDLRRAASQVIAADAMAARDGEVGVVETVSAEDAMGSEKEISLFDSESHSTIINIPNKGARDRKVLLTIATTKEAEEVGLLRERGAWDHGNPKGCFRFQDLGDGQYNDIG